MKAHTHKKTFVTILLALVVAVIAVPGALAGPKKITVPAALSHIQHPGWVSVSSTQTATVPASLARIQEPGGASDFDTYNFVQPTGVYESVLRQPTSAGAAAAGFAWRDAAIGGAFVLGLALLAAGGVLAVGRQTPAAQQS
jgi:hypothetical protein